MGEWKKLSKEEINKRVFAALDENVDFFEENPLGIPGSHLDDKVFYHDAPFLKDAPYLSTLIHNPNHIGCHTLGKSEPFFKGTQAIEQELIAICAGDILNGAPDDFDGYVASGGTEANMQAIWIYRNFFIKERGVRPDQICILCSADAHYSMAKAANVLGVRYASVQVQEDNRELIADDIQRCVEEQTQQGVRHFVVVANMMTTMFGSVDEVEQYTTVLQQANAEFKVHIDGAYGGFIYPFTNPDNELDFRNPLVNSVTLDAHKMVQAPYGTGIFLIRKGWMKYANTESASYVEGEDFTFIGSRSGANAVAVWMILMTYGRFGWEEKMSILLKRTQWLVEQLNNLKVRYFRNPHANIVTIDAHFINASIAAKYGLVPDSHQNPKWYKVVVMEHVTIEKLLPLTKEISTYIATLKT